MGTGTVWTCSLTQGAIEPRAAVELHALRDWSGCVPRPNEEGLFRDALDSVDRLPKGGSEC